jgi:hypothetical protein
VNKFILGSGINGLLARFILGDKWQIIPFGRSRFYSFSPPLADNHLVFHKDIDDIIRRIGFNPTIDKMMRAVSYNGQLIFSDESFAKNFYLAKLFGEDRHPAGSLLLRHELNIYRYATATEVYSSLQKLYKNEINEAIQKYGTINNINMTSHVFDTDKGTFEYSALISTIPLDALLTYIGNQMPLPSKDVWYYQVTTPTLNFEGAKQVFVADAPYDFFKVDRLGNNQYTFHCHRDLGNPEVYLGAFTNNKVSIDNSTHMIKAYPIGPPPSVSNLELNNIHPVGSHAQWDYFMDVSSSLRRLTKMYDL